jgi:hypothetical protein
MVKKNIYKDMKPQYFRMIVAQTAANTYKEAEFPTPIVQNLGNERSLVMEILKVIIDMNSSELVNAQIVTISMHIADRSQTTVRSVSEPGVLIDSVKEVACIDTAITEGTIGVAQPPQLQVVDLTDGAGNGILYGKSTMFIAIEGSNNINIKRAKAALIYRLIEVPASELIGIINS